MDGCPLGLELVVEDKPTEFSCVCVHVCVQWRIQNCGDTWALGY